MHDKQLVDILDLHKCLPDAGKGVRKWLYKFERGSRFIEVTSSEYLLSTWSPVLPWVFAYEIRTTDSKKYLWKPVLTPKYLFISNNCAYFVTHGRGRYWNGTWLSYRQNRWLQLEKYLIRVTGAVSGKPHKISRSENHEHLITLYIPPRLFGQRMLNVFSRTKIPIYIRAFQIYLHWQIFTTSISYKDGGPLILIH